MKDEILAEVAAKNKKETEIPEEAEIEEKTKPKVARKKKRK